jgi:hypothetical protein
MNKEISGQSVSVNPPFVEQTVQQTMEMLEQGQPQHKILALLIDAAEKVAGNNSVSSILILDKEGLLRNASSPQLPYD